MQTTHAEKEADLLNGEDKVVNVKKRTTKVNIWVVVAVLAFFAFCGVLAGWMRAHPQHVTNSVHEEMKNP